jgi:hypothetical protein
MFTMSLSFLMNSCETNALVEIVGRLCSACGNLVNPLTYDREMATFSLRRGTAPQVEGKVRFFGGCDSLHATKHEETEKILSKTDEEHRDLNRQHAHFGNLKFVRRFGSAGQKD